MKIEIVSATRHSREDFWSKSALGLSLRRLAHDTDLIMRIAVSNARGLPQIYNEYLASGPDSIVVLVHDDVWLEDCFLRQRLAEGLGAYDVIGVAGNRRRAPAQPGWAFLDAEGTWDEPGNLSGAVAHGQTPFGAIKCFGETPADCELLDGVFLAARKSVLRGKQLRFDPRFNFNFYDLDFCRSARQRGLRLGTWPIAMTHQSLGAAFGGPQWRSEFAAYLAKWGD